MPKRNKIEDFWNFVSIDGGGCWLWLGSLHKNGKPRWRWKGKSLYAHRVAFSEHYSKNIDGTRLEKTCGSILCVNPEHHWRITPRNVFFDRIIIKDGCWGWSGNFNKDGYPVFDIDRKPFRATRFSWMFFNEREIPKCLHVLHRCDNPECTNPEHLFLGDHKDNMDDAKKKMRFAHGEGHYKSKLKNTDIKEIIDMYDSGNYTTKEISKIFGVSRSNISSIIRKDSWGWLD